ncbi:DUF4097 family beta strand repeat-containing protein [Maribacter sp. X9]|uniref:DUF4097 family beta strand repeat-containing protein n=1 Tax=Maribacter sp. X9 TaxID=3402159 RepID=UPI003AF3347A
MRIDLLVGLLLISVSLNSQKRLNKIVDAEKINSILVDAANCFEVNLNTRFGKQVDIEAKMEGEYRNDIDLKARTNGTTLFIEVGFIPSFENPNDKLSAHKTVSILMDITVPSFKNIKVYGTNSRVNLQGEYKELLVTLSDGTCRLNDVSGNVVVKTQSGNIIAQAKSADIFAESKYGKVQMNPVPKGITNYKLQTITGNIELSKTE